MDAPSYRKLLTDGLWSNNVIFTQLLALCPLMAVTTTATNGLGMGLVTMVVLIASNVLVSMIRNWVPNSIRIPIFTLLIAALVTLVDQAMNAWLHDLHRVLGLFIALIVVNCAILGRAEAFAIKNRPLASAADGLGIGLGFTLALVIVGGCREVIGSGTLFAGASLLLGPHFKFMELTLLPGYRGFLLMMLPPGGFIMLGLILSAIRLGSTLRVKAAQPSRSEGQPGGCHV
ncbi:electron transport complex subunit E [Pseudaeromonas sharmana]|uniref:Ion-translocating oxidoreductase complex subunit E n=1 Tax=Pseudaeromonas sharmana TaxID=328412 RepID=A0ABV8CJH7_9GAMM